MTLTQHGITPGLVYPRVLRWSTCSASQPLNAVHGRCVPSCRKALHCPRPPVNTTRANDYKLVSASEHHKKNNTDRTTAERDNVVPSICFWYRKWFNVISTCEPDTKGHWYTIPILRGGWDGVDWIRRGRVWTDYRSYRGSIFSRIQVLFREKRIH